MTGCCSTIFLLVCYIAILKVSSGQECIQNCSTFSEDIHKNNLQHSVSCSIQSEKCLLRNSSNRPDMPINKSSRKPFYFYPNNSIANRIGLNFSWGPQHNGLVQHVQGYRISIQKEGEIFPDLYYCIDTKLDFFAHALSTFYDDCFGLTDAHIIKPGQAIDVFINSLPETKENRLHIPIHIPSCKAKKMQKFYECEQRTKVNILAINVFCSTHLIQVFYYVPLLFENKFCFQFCEGANISNSCIKEISSYCPDVFSEVFNFSFPDKYHPAENYSLSVVLLNSTEILTSKLFYFNDCFVAGSLDLWIYVLLAVIVILIILFTLVLAFACKHSQTFKLFGHRFRANTKTDQTKVLTPLPASSFQTIPTPTPLLEEPTQPIKLFIIFFNDHVKHKTVILQFINFLTKDLGFDVVCELHHSKEICEDYVNWQERNFREADKIVVVWSPGAKKQWENYNNACAAENCNEVKMDLFSPIVTKILKDLNRNNTKNIAKYLFVYFDYCSSNDIPDQFRDHCVCCLIIMKQFQTMYFRLKNIERFMPGGVIREEKVTADHYFDTNLNKHGNNLRDAIEEMRKFVRQFPDWFEQKYSSPIEISNQSMPLIRDDDDMVQINVFKVLPPPPTSKPVSSKRFTDLTNIGTTNISEESTELHPLILHDIQSLELHVDQHPVCQSNPRPSFVITESMLQVQADESLPEKEKPGIIADSWYEANLGERFIIENYEDVVESSYNEAKWESVEYQKANSDPVLYDENFVVENFDDINDCNEPFAQTEHDSCISQELLSNNVSHNVNDENTKEFEKYSQLTSIRISNECNYVPVPVVENSSCSVNSVDSGYTSSPHHTCNDSVISSASAQEACRADTDLVSKPNRSFISQRPQLAPIDMAGDPMKSLMSINSSAIAGNR